MCSSDLVKEPWLLIEPVFAAAACAELRRELGPYHILKGKSVTALARRQDCDDVLFSIDGAARECAVVHLTYSRKEEADPAWPFTEVFSSIEAWCTERMLPDHEDFVSA